MELSPEAKKQLEQAIVEAICDIIPAVTEAMARIFTGAAQATAANAELIQDGLIDYQRQLGPSMAIATQTALAEQIGRLSRQAGSANKSEPTPDITESVLPHAVNEEDSGELAATASGASEATA